MISPLSSVIKPSVSSVSPEMSSSNSTFSQIGHAATPSFADTMRELASNAIQTLQNGETSATLGVQGKLPAQEVVQAVMAAEQTLQTSVAIRDKVIAAYLDLTKMPI